RRPYSPLSAIPHTHHPHNPPLLLPHHIQRPILLPQRPAHSLVQPLPMDGSTLPRSVEFMGCRGTLGR
ncbi:MAG: hypothetical protein Q9180_008665, partial [Flavoplaca navasiana]